MSRLEKVPAELLALLGYVRDEYFRPAEQITRSRLSPGQFHTLSTLGRKGGLPMSELAAELKISKQQLTPMIAKMIDNRLVVRKTDAHDRRIVLIEISAAGRSTIETLMAEIKRNFTEKMRQIPEIELEELEQMITRMQVILHHSQ